MSDLLLGKAECEDEEFEVWLDDSGGLSIPGYDLETALALYELGFDPSPCVLLIKGYEYDPVRALLYFLPIDVTAVLGIAIGWMTRSLMFDPPKPEEQEIKDYLNRRQFTVSFLEKAKLTYLGKYVSFESTYTAKADAEGLLRRMEADGDPHWAVDSLVGFVNLMQIVNVFLDEQGIMFVDHELEVREALRNMSYVLYDADLKRFENMPVAKKAENGRIRFMAEMLTADRDAP